MNNINLKDIDLNLLVVFDCIYQEKNLTLVGKRLGRTQSAVSHALERLRGLFDDRLFVRTPQGMRTTPRAQELAFPIRETLGAFQKIIQPPINFDPRNLEQAFRISMSDYSEIIVLPRLMEILYQEAPKVQIEVLSPATSGPQAGLETGTYDLIIGNQDVSAGIYQQKLFEDQFICLVSQEHPEIQNKMSVEQYLKFPHVLFAPQGRGDRLLEDSLQQEGLKRKVALRIPHILVIPRVVKNTPYIVTIPRKFAEALDDPSLQLLKPPIKLPQLHVMQYWHEAMHQDPAHQWLRRVVHSLAEMVEGKEVTLFGEGN